jgi:hypothetical protein
MTAVGQGLYASGIRPSKPSRTWALLDPERSFAACRELMMKHPGLPFLSPEIHELRTSGMDPAQLYKVFRFVEYFGKGRQEPPGPQTNGESGALYRKICMLLYTYSISCGGN